MPTGGMDPSRGQPGGVTAQGQAGQPGATQGQTGSQSGQAGAQQGGNRGQQGSMGEQQSAGAQAGNQSGGGQTAAGGQRADGQGGLGSAQSSGNPAQNSGSSGTIDFSEAAGSRGGGGGEAGGQHDTGGQVGGGSSLPSAASYEERVAILDGQLEGSMAEYDGMILRERRNILERAGESGSEQQVETFDRNVAYYDEGDLDSDQEESRQQPGLDDDGGRGDNQVAQAGGSPYGSNAGAPGRANDRAYAPPADIPSGDDDDVVARQIREAAMHEDDPELREKLWEEYRKYKEQTR